MSTYEITTDDGSIYQIDTADEIQSEESPPLTFGEDLAGGLSRITNTATLGFGDEIIGAGNALMDRFSPWSDFQGTLGEAYDNRLGQVRELNDRWEQEHPYGKWAVDLPTMLAMPIGEGLSAVKGVRAKATELAKLGAALGGVSGFGQSEGGFGNRVSNAITGAETGAFLAPALGLPLEGAIRGGSLIYNALADRISPARGANAALKDLLTVADEAVGSDIAKYSPTNAQNVLAGEVSAPAIAEKAALETKIADSLASQEAAKLEAQTGLARTVANQEAAQLEAKSLLERELARQTEAKAMAADDLASLTEFQQRAQQEAKSQLGEALSAKTKDLNDLAVTEADVNALESKAIPGFESFPKKQPVDIKDVGQYAKIIAEDVFDEAIPVRARYIINRLNKSSRKFTDPATGIVTEENVVSASKARDVIRKLSPFTKQKSKYGEFARRLTTELKDSLTGAIGDDAGITYLDTNELWTAVKASPERNREVQALARLKNPEARAKYVAAKESRLQRLFGEDFAFVKDSATNPDNFESLLALANNKKPYAPEGLITAAKAKIEAPAKLAEEASLKIDRPQELVEAANAKVEAPTELVDRMKEVESSLGGRVASGKVEPSKLADAVLASPEKTRAVVSGLSPDGQSQLKLVAFAKALAKGKEMAAHMKADGRWQTYHELFTPAVAEKMIAAFESKGSVGSKLTASNDGWIAKLAGFSIGRMFGLGPIGEVAGAITASKLFQAPNARAELLAEVMQAISRGEPKALQYLEMLRKPATVSNMQKLANALPGTSTKFATIDRSENKESRGLVSTAQAEELPVTPDEHSKLVDAMVKAESAGNPKAVSKAGAKGLAQLMDATGEEWSKKLGYAKYDPFDEKQNKHIGGEYLKWLVNKFGGDVKLGLASYNAGIGNVLKALAKAAKAGKSRSFENALAYLPKPEETGPYVKRVMKNYQA